MIEDVMVVPTEELAPWLTRGIITGDAKTILGIIDARHSFLSRPVAEVSPAFRQIIPYVVISHEDQTFLLRRTSKQTESRLHHKMSLGIGGHINPGHSVMEGLTKELEEEVRIDDRYELTFAGILNDDSTDVGRVHLGLVYFLRASSNRVSVLETEKMVGEWAGAARLAESRESMESWSQIVYDELLTPRC